MAKKITIAFFVAIALGYILVNPWYLLAYSFLLAVATAVGLYVIVASLVKRIKEWKAALLCLAIAFIPVLSSRVISSYLSSRIQHNREQAISRLYEYRDRYGQFPNNADEIRSNLSAVRGNYVRDSATGDFVLYTMDLYGMPWDFRSKDSIWGR